MDARVYPRPHGEAANHSASTRVSGGLSPPTRGSRRDGERWSLPHGSIPAHTGKPPRCGCRQGRRGVYPRPHGEAAASGRAHRLRAGLSPPTRGSLAGPLVVGPTHGSIPAHTGKPANPKPWWRADTVYPRPHGEAGLRQSALGGLEGLSPPTRGSRLGACGLGPRHRSIPAHTGKPRRPPPRRPPARVYPRPHGEAPISVLPAAAARGLSPPTRGSPRRTINRAPPRGSIPAHTGKPWARAGCCSRCWVYPRPHGEAGPCPLCGGVDRGLSPPTRGSHKVDGRALVANGSIPAHTGKPPPRRRRRASARVYPRPHGEAVQLGAGLGRVGGLSPPTRGSRWLAGEGGPRRWSIPAHTGKPASPGRRSRLRGVYPRPHGEASETLCGVRHVHGLSPPTRGSRH